ncbi:hypothetical protein KC318_g2 [Hortaea werneckii]|nr:hypothetical protein KC334_g2 [Hortaea werneckii]KAI7028388.1 hypothetical protein KC355_g2 [Hortaea werneckii]KAI7676807.1 hypothetical protein KC318_g2 [Hortaea werneckii]
MHREGRVCNRDVWLLGLCFKGLGRPTVLEYICGMFTDNDTACKLSCSKQMSLSSGRQRSSRYASHSWSIKALQLERLYLLYTKPRMHERLCRRHSFLWVEIHKPDNDVSKAFVLLCLGPVYEWLVRNILVSSSPTCVNRPLMPSLSPKYDTSLLEIFVVFADHLVVHGEDTLLLLAVNSFVKHCRRIHTTRPNENISVGLPSSPLKWASTLRQTSLPANMPLIHRPSGRCAAFSRSESMTRSTVVASSFSERKVRSLYLPKWTISRSWSIQRWTLSKKIQKIAFEMLVDEYAPLWYRINWQSQSFVRPVLKLGPYSLIKVVVDVLRNVLQDVITLLVSTSISNCQAATVRTRTSPPKRFPEVAWIELFGYICELASNRRHDDYSIPTSRLDLNGCGQIGAQAQDILPGRPESDSADQSHLGRQAASSIGREFFDCKQRLRADCFNV